jgi:hypothetical protein
MFGQDGNPDGAADFQPVIVNPQRAQDVGQDRVGNRFDVGVLLGLKGDDEFVAAKAADAPPTGALRRRRAATSTRQRSPT